MDKFQRYQKKQESAGLAHCKVWVPVDARDKLKDYARLLRGGADIELPSEGNAPTSEGNAPTRDDLPEPTANDLAAVIRAMTDRAPKAMMDRLKEGVHGIPCFSYTTLVKTFSSYRAALEKATKADSRKALGLVAKILDVQARLFNSEFNQAVGSRLKERELACAKKEKAIRAREKSVAKGKIIYSDEAFSPTEIRALRSALHTDRLPSQASRLKAMQILNAKLN